MQKDISYTQIIHGASAVNRSKENTVSAKADTVFYLFPIVYIVYRDYRFRDCRLNRQANSSPTSATAKQIAYSIRPLFRSADELSVVMLFGLNGVMLKSPDQESECSGSLLFSPRDRL